MRSGFRHAMRPVETSQASRSRGFRGEPSTRPHEQRPEAPILRSDPWISASSKRSGPPSSSAPQLLLVLEAYLYFCSGWTLTAFTGFFRPPIGFGTAHSSPPAAKTSEEGVRLGPSSAWRRSWEFSVSRRFSHLIDSADYPIHAVPTLVAPLVCNPDASELGCLSPATSKSWQTLPAR